MHLNYDTIKTMSFFIKTFVNPWLFCIPQSTIFVASFFVMQWNEIVSLFLRNPVLKNQKMGEGKPWVNTIAVLETRPLLVAGLGSSSSEAWHTGRYRLLPLYFLFKSSKETVKAHMEVVEDRASLVWVGSRSWIWTPSKLCPKPWRK